VSRYKKRKGCLWWMAVIFICLAATSVIIGVADYLGETSCAPRTKAGPEPPSVADAPWMIDTLTRVYYSKNEPVANGVIVILEGYYTVYKGKWVYSEDFLQLPRKRYGEIKISKRSPP
jgi:hypothetical protein